MYKQYIHCFSGLLQDHTETNDVVNDGQTKINKGV